MYQVSLNKNLICKP